jgi:ribulose-phosphate 3-epimerase
MNITPAILAHSFEEVTEKLSRIEGLVTRVQIDLCDGVFGREKTWLPQGNEALPQHFTYEYDIMLNDWLPYVTKVLEMGASSIVAHVDQFTDPDIESLVSTISPRQVPLGIAVSNDKSVDFHADMIRKVQALYPNIYIQIMGIHKIGEQGQFFDEEALLRIRGLSQQFGGMPIQVDGGMNPLHAQKVLDAGAQTIVVGSFIFAEDPGTALKELESLTTAPE